MKKKINAVFGTLFHWIAAGLRPRNDGWQVNNRHCEGALRPRQSSERRHRSTHGFSLIELLISLIVISLIIASFTPVLSKKLKHRELAYSKIKQMKIDCSSFNTSQGQCLLCDEHKCSLCTSSINVPDGYYVNPNLSCNRKPCSDFNSNCKRCTKDGCQECKSGYILNADGSCSEVKCGKGYKVSGTSCTKCEANTIQPNDNFTGTTCSACRTNEVANSLHTECNCDTGFASVGGSCISTSCPNGFWNGSGCTYCSSYSISHGRCISCNASSGCTDVSCDTGYHKNGVGCAQDIVSCSGATYRDESTNTCKDCPTNCTSCTSSSWCTGCSENYSLSSGSCVYDPCGSSAVLIEKDNLKFCMKKRNLGDGADYGTVESSWYTNTTSKTTPKCWRGSGLNYTCTEPLRGGGYSGCNRTACNWTAGVQGCQKIGWDLPTRE